MTRMGINPYKRASQIIERKENKLAKVHIIEINKNFLFIDY